MRTHCDDRRIFYGDIFDTECGDVNLAQLHPGITIAWHRHHFQDDKIWLLDGDVMIQAIDPEGIRHGWHWQESPSAPLFIPRGWWHGYSTEHGATILSFNGPRKWDGTDEERMSTETTAWIIL